MIIKKGKSPRLVWDGSTKLEPDDIVMNDIVPLEKEAIATFGRVKNDYSTHLFNTRASYPKADIDLSFADITSAHRYTRVYPCLTAAFGYMIVGMYYFITTAMVFGSRVSATSWEPFRRAIEVTTEKFSLRSDLVEKHKAYLDLVVIEPPAPPGTIFTLAVKDQLNPGVLDHQGNQKPIPNYIYVDDCLLACIRVYTLQLLAACIEAIFVVLGEPNTSLRRCPLSLDKWTGLHVGHRTIQIGLIFDSPKLTIGITHEYLDQVLAILETEWPIGFVDFTLKSIVTLTGKLARLGEAAPWVFHLMTHIYASIAYPLRKNHASLLKSDKSFQIQSIKSKGFAFYQLSIRTSTTSIST